jgi:hypothetical protein
VHALVVLPFVVALAQDEAPPGDAPPPPEALDAAEDTPADTVGPGTPEAETETGTEPETEPPAEADAAPLVPALDASLPASTEGSTSTPAMSSPSWWRGFWSGALHVSGSIAPVPTLGLTAGAGVGGRWWSMRAEGSIGNGADEDQTVSALPLAVAVVPCIHLGTGGGTYETWGLVACATGTAALVPVGGRFDGLGPYVGAGGRAGVETRATDGGALRAFVQLEAPVVGFRLHADDGEVFTSPPVNVVLGVAADVPGG